jgi:glycerol uptake facilitator-like aquaporin
MNKYIAEFVGTFFFISIILNALKKNTGMSSIPIAIGIGLVAAIILVGPISGAHLNPAVSFVTYLNNSISQNELAFYVMSQYLGAFAAKMYFDKLK